MRRLKIYKNNAIKTYNINTPEKYTRILTINLPKKDYGTIKYEKTTNVTSFFVNDIVIKEYQGDFFEKFSEEYVQAVYEYYYLEK